VKTSGQRERKVRGEMASYVPDTGSKLVGLWIKVKFREVRQFIPRHTREGKRKD
jgi:hypothetical protein